MATLIGEVKEMKGDYFRKDEDGNIKKIAHGDIVYEGDTLYGAKDNTFENALLIALVLSGKDLILIGDESQRFDSTLSAIASDDNVAQTDPLSVALLNDAIEAHLRAEDTQVHTSGSSEQVQTPLPTGISTSQYTQNEEQSTDVTAELSETEMVSGSDEKVHHDTQDIAGIIDLDSAIHHSEITTDPTTAVDVQKSVHTDVLQAAKENSEMTSDLTKREANDVFAEEDVTHDNGFDTLLTGSTCAVNYDDISSSVREVQLSQNSGTQTIKTLSIEDVLDITPQDEHTLRIIGDSDDTVDLKQETDPQGLVSQWTKATDSIIGDDGNTYDVYTGISGTDTITLQIDQNITVTDF